MPLYNEHTAILCKDDFVQIYANASCRGSAFLSEHVQKIRRCAIRGYEKSNEESSKK